MSDTINYNKSIIMAAFAREVRQGLGEGAWDALTQGIGVPDEKHEATCGCSTMRELMFRFDRMADGDQAKSVLTRVRHGLTHSQFAWAKERFAACGSIDAFIEDCFENEANNFRKLHASGQSFYGQVVDDRVLEFVLNQPGMLAPVRKGSDLYVTAFPSNTSEYLRATDDRMKRYHACHCPFAKESILRDEGPVSKTLCYCSLGHVTTMWEAISDRELDGDVIGSALGGDLLCTYVIHLPPELVARNS